MLSQQTWGKIVQAGVTDDHYILCESLFHRQGPNIITSTSAYSYLVWAATQNARTCEQC